MKNAKVKNVRKWIPAFAGMTGRGGSALILTVVLTSLLAVIGIMFVMAANMDRITTSAVSANKELQFAIDSVIAQISQVLIEDVPGVSPATNTDYFDYPDGSVDPWLANLEPESGNNWRHISDLYVEFSGPGLTPRIVPEYEVIPLDNNGDIDRNSDRDRADADGDGVSDSRWTELRGITSAKGKPFYAAIRIIDNGGMLNVNTAREFNPNSTIANEVDGSRQTQINLLALADRGSNLNPLNELDAERFGSEAHNPDNYIDDVVRRYYRPDGEYTPFDITDELKLRNRFIINQNNIISRIEELWERGFDGPPYVPRNSNHNINDANDWFWIAANESSNPDTYNYRHIATTYNFDRIINPSGNKMLTLEPNIPAQDLYNVLSNINNPTMTSDAAQLAVNIADYLDDNNDISAAAGRYGIEPQPFISEIGIDVADITNVNLISFAVELYNPFDVDINLNGKFFLELPKANQRIPLTGTIAHKSHYVIVNHNVFGASDQIDSALKLATYILNPDNSLNSIVSEDTIYLTCDVSGTKVYLDRQDTQSAWFVPGTQFFERDDRANVNYGLHVVYQEVGQSSTGSIGGANNYQLTSNPSNWKFNWLPFNANNRFVAIGDISRVFKIGPSTDPNTIGQQLMAMPNTPDDENRLRVDLRNPDYRNIFQYLTVFDPSNDFDSSNNAIDNDGDNLINEKDLTKPAETPELKIAGRININTAPWYVIAQLPWITSHLSSLPGGREYSLARAIVAYRDKLSAPVDYNNRGAATGISNMREDAGFESVGELNFLIDGDDAYRIDYYFTVSSAGNLTGFPDLDGPLQRDSSDDDFEERDVIFSRISNLVTVRSDVFTAYILVRLGADGPQKRVIAILDRSDVYPSDGKVKVVALWPVPEAR